MFFQHHLVVKTIATSLIDSKLDYCNSVLFNVIGQEISKLLRSSNLDQLHVPRVRTAVGSRTFSVAAPRLWNEHPLEIRSAKTRISFRKKLKHIFLVRLFQLKSAVFRLARTTNANGFGTMSQITIMFITALEKFFIIIIIITIINYYYYSVLVDSHLLNVSAKMYTTFRISISHS